MKLLDRLSLKARLCFLYAVLLICSVVLVGFCSYWNIWQLFINNKSTQLRARAKPIIEHWLEDNALSGGKPPGIELDSEKALELARDLTSKDAVAIILGLGGEVIANGRRLPEEPEAPAPDRQALFRALSGENEVTYCSEVDGRPVLVVLIPLRPGPGSPHVIGIIQISATLSDLYRILFRHGAMLFSLVSLILVVGILGGFYLIGVSLRDMRVLLDTCNRISRGDFFQKVPVRNGRDEIGQLAIAFNEMIQRIEATFASQQRFVANAAHELLTPLTGLRGSLEVLLRGAQDDPQATARLLKGMYREVKRLIRLCEQLLGLSMLESSANVHKQQVILSEFFRDFEPQARLLARPRQVVIRPGPYVRMSADPDILRQILLNLLSNALRYSPVHTPVIMGWRLLPEQVEIYVSDQGEGMDAETMSRAFEPFYQGKVQPRSGSKSIGLGLSLSKSMVEAHNGTIRVESQRGKGTTVTFTLPIR